MNTDKQAVVAAEYLYKVTSVNNSIIIKICLGSI